MQLLQSVLGTHHPETLNSMNNLAATFMSQGRWAEAEPLQVQAVEAAKTVLGEKHPDRLSCMQNLANTLYYQARYEEALALIGTCSQMQQQVLGEQHAQTQASLKLLNEWRAELAKGDS
jgi:hypothetical protein